MSLNKGRGHGIDIFKKYNKTFNYKINTKNLNELYVLIEKLTEKNRKKYKRNNVKTNSRRTNIKYSNIKK